MRSAGNRLGALLIAMVTGVTPALADWQYVEETDPLTDKVMRSISTTATTDALARPARLRIACFDGKTILGIFVGIEIVDASDLRYRVDKDPARTVMMANFRGNLFTDGQDAFDLAQELKEGQSLFLRATPYVGPVIDLTFDISGLAEAVQPIAEHCNWQYYR